MASNKNDDISVIIPIYNEEESISELYNRLVATLKNTCSSYELVFVNDNSSDKSLQLIQELSEKDSSIKYISFTRNFGHQIALTAGLNYCQGKAVVIIDADLQDPPELIEQLYKKYKEGFKVVNARRKKRKGENFIVKFTAHFFYRIMARMTSIDIPLDTGDYRLIDHKVVEQLNNMPESHKFLRGQISWIGFKQTEVLYDRDPRKHGSTGYPFRKRLRFALDGITAFSNYPLKIASLSGIFVSGIAFIIILYALYSKYVLEEAITGWTSLLISTMFIGGIQLLSIGIIGEYISRINSNVRKRPLYIVEDSNVEEDNSDDG